jgi:AcrR family transcriptional regulator
VPRINAESIAEHRTVTRARLLEGAAALFRSLGYDDTTLADISGYAGIGRTTVYEYFVDKEDLLVNLVEEKVPAVLDDLLQGLPSELSTRERLGELIIRSLEYVSGEDALGSSLMRQLPALSPEAQARIGAAHAPIHEEIERLCTAGITSGELQPFDPADMGHLVFALVMAASQGLIRDGDAKQRVHEVGDMLVRVVFDGLSA